MAINFPNDPGLTPNFQYTSNGITQNWVWGRSIEVNGVSGPSAWIAQKFEITAGDSGFQGFQGFQGVPGDSQASVQGPTGFQGFQGRQGNQGFQGFQGRQGFQGFQGRQGFQGFQGRQGNQGFQGFQGATGIPSGNDNEIQYRIGSSFSANSRSMVATDANLSPSSGYSGNFLKYSESLTANNSEFLNGGTVTLDFNRYNIFRATNIKLGSDRTLTFSGFSSAVTGQSMTLVLGHTGANNSKIVIPKDIYWPNGPIGGGGETTVIEPAETKRFDILYFFHDGQNLYGNISQNHRTS